MRADGELKTEELAQWLEVSVKEHMLNYGGTSSDVVRLRQAAARLRELKADRDAWKDRHRDIEDILADADITDEALLLRIEEATAKS